MDITENEIEEIVYSSPWLIDERFIVSAIAGSQGVNGRQVNVGKSTNRFIDILFKDTRDQRPVIIEIKKNNLIRENIGQILEYRSLIISMNESEKEAWIADFGINYFAPKMILVGSNASEDIIIAANLANIDIRLFDLDFVEKISLSQYLDIGNNLKAWDNFRKEGKRSIPDRIEWCRGFLDRIKVITEEYESVRTIDIISDFNEKKYYANKYSVFIDFPLFYKEKYLLGFYEYYTDPSPKKVHPEIPFSDEFIYSDYSFLYDFDVVDSELLVFTNKVREYYTSLNLDYFEYDGKFPVAKIPREFIESNIEFDNILKKLIDNGIELIVMALLNKNAV